MLTYKQYSTFEEFYVNITHSFYLAESAEQAEALKDNPKEFFIRGKERIDEEINRSKKILPVTAWALVREITEKAFWCGRMEWLSQKSIAYSCLTKTINYLSLKSFSFSRFHGQQRLCRIDVHVHALRKGRRYQVTMRCIPELYPSPYSIFIVVDHLYVYLFLRSQSLISSTTRIGMKKWYKDYLSLKH